MRVCVKVCVCEVGDPHLQLLQLLSLLVRQDLELIVPPGAGVNCHFQLSQGLDGGVGLLQQAPTAEGQAGGRGTLRGPPQLHRGHCPNGVDEVLPPATPEDGIHASM
jgi:hypothetical protein